MQFTREDPYSDKPMVTGRICERCQHESHSIPEFQEYLHITLRAGYGARIFKDGDEYASDLCEPCVQEVLGPYLRLQSTQTERDEEWDKKSRVDQLLAVLKQAELGMQQAQRNIQGIRDIAGEDAAVLEKLLQEMNRVAGPDRPSERGDDREDEGV